MPCYETIFIVKPEKTPEETEKDLELILGNMQSHNCDVLDIEKWGRKKLAYKIENFAEGYYFLIKFNSEASYPKELEKRYNFNENIIRYITVKLDNNYHTKKKTEDEDKVEQEEKSSEDKVEQEEKVTEKA